MASPKVQLIRDFGCGMGSFALSHEPQVLEGVAESVTADEVVVTSEGQVLARILRAATQRSEVGGVVVVECPPAVEATEPGDGLRLILAARQIQNLKSGHIFTFTRK